ncbi:MAG: hypothetical protein HC923_00180 [Myxococcales bacterium]|nr:hypothetical protein [Myxococcales bacterium]
MVIAHIRGVRHLLTAGLSLSWPLPLAAADGEPRRANDGNLVLEDIPVLPDDIVQDLERYQNIRGAEFLSWSSSGESVFIKTRFGDVDQIHRVGSTGWSPPSDHLRPRARGTGGSAAGTLDAGIHTRRWRE